MWGSGWGAGQGPGGECHSGLRTQHQEKPLGAKTRSLEGGQRRETQFYGGLEPPGATSREPHSGFWNGSCLKDGEDKQNLPPAGQRDGCGEGLRGSVVPGMGQKESPLLRESSHVWEAEQPSRRQT